MRNFQILDFDNFIKDGSGIVFIGRNIGDSVGKIIEIRSATIVRHPNDRFPTNYSFPFSEKFQINLKSGEKELFPINGGSALNNSELVGIYSGNFALFCLGIIVYEDIAGTKRETGFLSKIFPWRKQMGCNRDRI